MKKKNFFHIYLFSSKTVKLNLMYLYYDACIIFKYIIGENINRIKI